MSAGHGEDKEERRGADRGAEREATAAGRGERITQLTDYKMSA